MSGLLLLNRVNGYIINDNIAVKNFIIPPVL
jgi:hypothetical protein